MVRDTNHSKCGGLDPVEIGYYLRYKTVAVSFVPYSSLRDLRPSFRNYTILPTIRQEIDPEKLMSDTYFLCDHFCINGANPVLGYIVSLFKWSYRIHKV